MKIPLIISKPPHSFCSTSFSGFFFYPCSQPLLPFNLQSLIFIQKNLPLAAFLLWGNSPTKSCNVCPSSCPWPPWSSCTSLSLPQTHSSKFDYFCRSTTLEIFFYRLCLLHETYVPLSYFWISTSFLAWKYILGILTLNCENLDFTRRNY